MVYRRVRRTRRIGKVFSVKGGPAQKTTALTKYVQKEPPDDVTVEDEDVKPLEDFPISNWEEDTKKEHQPVWEEGMTPQEKKEVK